MNKKSKDKTNLKVQLLSQNMKILEVKTEH